ncbi:hypothetical protein Tco_1510169, partial [Tanacetum coccineum]
DDELSTEKVSQELVEEMSQIIDETKLRKVVNEILRQRCTSGDEHQYHTDQMQNFLKNDIVEPKAPALSLVNQDLSLHKFPIVIFPDDDIEERTSKWVDKCMKKFNPYARYSVKHWKNPQAKIFYIKRQKEPGNPKEDVYSNSKIVEVIKHMPDYKNLNKNDIEDMYLLCVNGKIGVKSYQQKVNLTAPTITFPSIEKYKMFSIAFEPIYSIIYKNNKKEKRVMRHQEHGYVTPSLNKEDAEYLQLFEEGIKERLKHPDQMRHWEMYVAGRLLGSRRECPE